MTPSGVVTLLTDFGLRDPFVGVMRGVILSRFPRASIVDVTHDVAPQDVGEGAFWLARAYGYFPEGTVHVAVVDPGVGTQRAAVAARAGGHLFVGPDNGLLSLALARAGGFEARRVDEARFALPRLSRTFHGRDLFAPLAARLASGEARLEDVGPELEGLSAPPWPAPLQLPGRVEGRVATVDRFGNLLTDIDGALVRALGPGVVVELGALCLPLSGTYGEGEPGRPLALVSSFDVLEIAVRDGHASAALSAGKGDRVVARRG